VADPDHVAALLSGAEAWAEWRHARPGLRPDLSGVEVEGGQLERFDLSDCNLTGAVLSGRASFGSPSRMRWARFDNADLNGARLAGLDLMGCSFRGASLRKTRWEGSHILWVEFQNADLGEADFGLSFVAWSSFEGARLDGASIAGCRCVRVSGWPGAPADDPPAMTRRVRAATYVGGSVKQPQQATPTPQEQLRLLLEDRAAWNAWRDGDPHASPDLRGADLSGAKLSQARLADADLSCADLRRANLFSADLSGAFLKFADLTGADLRGAQLDECQLEDARLVGAQMQQARGRRMHAWGADLLDVDATSLQATESELGTARLVRSCFENADLVKASLRHAWATEARWNGIHLREARLESLIAADSQLAGASLSDADLTFARLQRADLTLASAARATLTGADLRDSNLSRADLVRVDLVGARLEGAKLSGARIYGAAAWDLKTDERTAQDGLIVTPWNEPAVRVDSIELAQFIYLLLNHQRLRQTIDSVTRRGVLLLGRFGGGGIEVLQAVAQALREAHYLPMIFDFERPADRNYTETVKTLVGLARFVVVDLSGRSVPQELMATVPHYKVPFIPILETGSQAYAMFNDIAEYDWVHRPVLRFDGIEDLLRQLPGAIIAPAETMHAELRRRRRSLIGDD
jgi:uncharacterized protein YjbI with pentapeptide repeats